jgi:hypothetical protein
VHTVTPLSTLGVVDAIRTSCPYRHRCGHGVVSGHRKSRRDGQRSCRGWARPVRPRVVRSVHCIRRIGHGTPAQLGRDVLPESHGCGVCCRSACCGLLLGRWPWVRGFLKGRSPWRAGLPAPVDAVGPRFMHRVRWGSFWGNGARPTTFDRPPVRPCLPALDATNAIPADVDRRPGPASTVEHTSATARRATRRTSVRSTPTRSAPNSSPSSRATRSPGRVVAHLLGFRPVPRQRPPTSCPCEDATNAHALTRTISTRSGSSRSFMVLRRRGGFVLSSWRGTSPHRLGG